MTNTDPTKKLRWTQVLEKGKQLLFEAVIRRPSCYLSPVLFEVVIRRPSCYLSPVLFEAVIRRPSCYLSPVLFEAVIRRPSCYLSPVKLLSVKKERNKYTFLYMKGKYSLFLEKWLFRNDQLVRSQEKMRFQQKCAKFQTVWRTNALIYLHLH
jgi:hypothetical protein